MRTTLSFTGCLILNEAGKLGFSEEARDSFIIEAAVCDLLLSDGTITTVPLPLGNAKIAEKGRNGGTPSRNVYRDFRVDLDVEVDYTPTTKQPQARATKIAPVDFREALKAASLQQESKGRPTVRGQK